MTSAIKSKVPIRHTHMHTFTSKLSEMKELRFLPGSNMSVCLPQAVSDAQMQQLQDMANREAAMGSASKLQFRRSHECCWIDIQGNAYMKFPGRQLRPFDNTEIADEAKSKYEWVEDGKKRVHGRLHLRRLPGEAGNAANPPPEAKPGQYRGVVMRTYYAGVDINVCNELDPHTGKAMVVHASRRDNEQSGRT